LQTTHEKVKRRTMQLLKNWSATFKKDETLGIVEETYESLKKNRETSYPEETGKQLTCHTSLRSLRR